MASFGSVAAMVTAVGRPRATSAAKLGPESTAGRGRRQRLLQHFGRPKLRCRAPAPWRRSRPACPSAMPESRSATSRTVCVGVASRIASAPSDVARSRSVTAMRPAARCPADGRDSRAPRRCRRRRGPRASPSARRGRRRAPARCPRRRRRRRRCARGSWRRSSQRRGISSSGRSASSRRTGPAPAAGGAQNNAKRIGGPPPSGVCSDPFPALGGRRLPARRWKKERSMLEAHGAASTSRTNRHRSCSPSRRR